MLTKTQYNQLQTFLHSASQSTWAAAGDSHTEKDGSTSFEYEQGAWHYRDNYFGSNPFAGREVVSFEGQAVFYTSYYGWVEADYPDVDGAYTFLKLALRQKGKQGHHRGPAHFETGNFTYKHEVDDLSNGFYSFKGTEKIFDKDKLVYQAWYFGGLLGE